MHRALVERAKGGDSEAFDALARQVGDRCMAIAFRILRDADQADDAVQAALIAAWRDIRKLRDPDRFEPWLHRILTNECYAEARRRRRLTANIRLLLRSDMATASDILTVNDRDQIDRAFRRLTLEQRTVLVFHYVGLTAEQIADRLDVPLGTVKSRPPGFEATEPVDMVVDGHPAVELTVTAPLAACGLYTWSNEHRTNGVSAGEANRLRIVDVDGIRVLIAAAYLPTAGKSGHAAGRGAGLPFGAVPVGAAGPTRRI